MKENLEKKLETNKELLDKLLKKKENLEMTIRNLENKIANQEHCLRNIPQKEQQFPTEVTEIN